MRFPERPEQGAQERDEGWVVVESLEAFDPYGGDRFPSRDVALTEARAGHASLASWGHASFSRELDGAFVVGRLRSARRLNPDGSVSVLYTLTSHEQHAMPVRPARPTGPTRPWTCPACRSTWNILAEEPEVPEDAAHCPKCGKPPAGFTPGQVVRVREGKRSRLGIVDEAVQAAVPVPGNDHVVTDEGPFTGEFMVWHLSHGYGSDEPLEPAVEAEIFRNLPREAERRLGLAINLMTGTSAEPESIHSLTAAEEQDFFGQPKVTTRPRG